MKLSTSHDTHRAHQEYFWLFVAVTIFVVLFSLPTHAADLFASAKTNIEETAGEGSSVHLSLMAAGLIGSMIVGYIAKNWVAGIATFVIGVIFWSVGQSIVFG